MTFFHQHHWKEKERHTVPPIDDFEVNGGRETREMMERLLIGQTILLLRCEGCGDIKSVSIPGITRPYLHRAMFNK